MKLNSFFNNLYKKIIDIKDNMLYNEECYYSFNDNIKENVITITNIIVPSQQVKEELLSEFEYLHDNHFIDKDFYVMQSLLKLVQEPDKIVVKYPD